MNLKKLLLICVGMIFSFNLIAQNELKIGVNAGINYPDVRGYDYAKYQNFNVGYLFGINFEYYLNENLSLKTNLNYERKSKEHKITYYNYDAEESGSKKFSEMYDYINVPVLVKYEFLNSHAFVNAGPFFNYLLNHKFEAGYPEEDSAISPRKKTDFGISLGIGAQLPLDEKHFFTLEVRDDFGMLDTGGVPDHLGGEMKTNTLKLILAWNLGL